MPASATAVGAACAPDTRRAHDRSSTAAQTLSSARMEIRRCKVPAVALLLLCDIVLHIGRTPDHARSAAEVKPAVRKQLPVPYSI